MGAQTKPGGIMRATIVKLLVMAVVVIRVFAHDLNGQGLPNVSQLALPGGAVQTTSTPRISSLRGDIQIVVQLIDPSLAAVQGPNAKKLGVKMSATTQLDYLGQLGRKQDALLAQIRNLGGRESGRLSKALNAVV